MTAGVGRSGGPRGDRAWLAMVAVVFLAWHVPLMYATAPGLDEDWFGVPGITILRSGLPRIPYLPSRDPSSFCYRADVVLYALPPLSFYLQAAAHLALGIGIGPARMASAVEGLVAAYLVYALALRWFGDRRGAILAAASYVASRAFFFPATTARPDMAATAFGLLAVYWADRARIDGRARSSAAAGVSAGLALLCHPFAVVPATQAAIRALAGPAPIRRRFRDAATFAAAALAAFSLWGLLIARHPDLFRVQFGNNVLNRAGPGLGATFLSPGPVLAYQARQALGRVMPIQAGLYAIGLAWALARAWRPGSGREFLYHFAASALLLVLFEGRHPTLGYYAYPAAFASIGMGMAASDAARLGGDRAGRWRRAIPALVTVALLAAFLPGSGLRSLVSHARHRGDPAYDARSVARAITADVPRGSLAAVDGPFVMEFYLAGRPVVEAAINTAPFDFRDEPYEFAVLGRAWEGLAWPRVAGLEFIKSYGNRDDEFAPYARLYRRSPLGRSARPALGPPRLPRGVADRDGPGPSHAGTGR